MGMVFTDGFDSYDSAAALRNRYRMSVTNPWTWDATAGRTGGGAATVNDAVAFALGPDRNTIFNSTALCIAFWMKLSSAPAATANVLGLGTSAVGSDFDRQYDLAVHTTGVLRHNVGTVVNGTTNVADNNWHWVELRNSFGVTGNAQVLYVDGVLQFSLTQSLIPTGTWSRFFFQGTPSRTLTIDDAMVWHDNVSGFPLISDFPIGESLITTMRPATDAAVQFDRSSGPVSNADAINETSLDLDDWVFSSGVGNQDLYDYDWIPPSPLPDSIHTVMLTSYMVNPDIGQVQRNHICESAGVQQTSTAARVSLTGMYVQTAFPTDPETAVAWESDGLGAATFGIRVAA